MPVVVCQREEQLQIVDGFKRLTAARVLDWPTLLVRRLETMTNARSRQPCTV